MRDFEWQYLEDNNIDNINNIDYYTEYMTDEAEHDDQYIDDDKQLESWDDYYNEISEEIEY